MSEIYPVALNLKGKVCLIVGGGAVATRKALGLLNTGAKIVVVSPAATPELEKLAVESQITLIRQPYTRAVLDNYRPFLVFAATSKPAINRQVASDADNALVNIVDSSSDNDFYNMTTIHRSPITVSIHSGNTSPALARHLNTVINESIGDEYIILARWLGKLRPEIKQRIPSQPQRQQLYQTILASDILPLLRQGDEQIAYQRLRHLVEG